MFKNKLIDTYSYEDLWVLYNGFQKLLDNRILFNDGLCYWISSAHRSKNISEYTHDLLQNYVNNNIPLSSKLRVIFINNDGFYWTRHNIEPRIKYIKKHMRKIQYALNILDNKQKKKDR